MPKKILSKAVGELLETGKATARASKKAASDVASQVGKTLVGHNSVSADKSSDLEWLEKAKGTKKAKSPVKKPKTQDEIELEQIDKLRQLDNKRSKDAYKQIQAEINRIRQLKGQAPRKYETGKAEFDVEQIKDPETFFEKLKKKKKEMKDKIMPWTKKKGQGTGENRRGASG